MSHHIVKSQADLFPYMEGFYPQFGRILANGNILVPFAGTLESGEKVDGRIEVTPDYPDYEEWLAVIHKANRLAKKKARKNGGQV